MPSHCFTYSTAQAIKVQSPAGSRQILQVNIDVVVATRCISALLSLLAKHATECMLVCQLYQLRV